MLIIADTQDETLIDALSVGIERSNGSEPLLNPVIKYSPDFDQDIICTEISVNESYSDERFSQLLQASLGVRYWGDHLPKISPIYGGKLSEDPKVIEKAVIDGNYAQTRARWFADFGVKYIGPTFRDPKHLLVVDNKKGADSLSPANSVDIGNFLSAVPDDWWQSLGVVSSGNVDKLAEFLDYLDFAIPIAYTDGGRAKLRHIGREFVDVEAPRNDSKYGIAVREVSNRLSYRLSLQ